MIEVERGGKFEVAGKLTIKGTAQNVVVPVALSAGAVSSGSSAVASPVRLSASASAGAWVAATAAAA